MAPLGLAVPPSNTDFQELHTFLCPTNRRHCLSKVITKQSKGASSGPKPRLPQLGGQERVPESTRFSISTMDEGFYGCNLSFRKVRTGEPNPPFQRIAITHCTVILWGIHTAEVSDLFQYCFYSTESAVLQHLIFNSKLAV